MISPDTHVELVFDRGTILLQAPPSMDRILRALPGVAWDPRVAVHRAPARLFASLREELSGRHIPVGTREPPGLKTAPEAWAGIDLRPYQEDALLAWGLAGDRGTVVLPTGSGKTRLAIAAMAARKKSTLCLVPTRVLLHQWKGEIAKVYNGEIGCLGDGDRVIAQITISTFESAYRHMARIGNRFGMLVVDEAHHFGSGVRDEALEMTTAAARLGLTATPPRDEGAASRIATLIGPTVFELTIGDLAGTFLASFESIVIRVDLTPEERRSYDGDLERYKTVHARFRDLVPEGSWADFARTASGSPEGREALRAWRRLRKLLCFPVGKARALAALLARHRESRLLVFTADNETAYTIARRHLIMPLTCDIGRRERDDVLARFRAGTIRALVSAQVLNEGIDVPDADVAIVVGGSLGEREHTQRVGRLLRPSAGKRALVYELVTRSTMEVRQAWKRRAGLDPGFPHPLQRAR